MTSDSFRDAPGESSHGASSTPEHTTDQFPSPPSSPPSAPDPSMPSTGAHPAAPAQPYAGAYGGYEPTDPHALPDYGQQGGPAYAGAGYPGSTYASSGYGPTGYGPYGYGSAYPEGSAYPAGGWVGATYPGAAPAPAPRRRRRRFAAAGASMLAAGAVVVGVAVGTNGDSSLAGLGSTSQSSGSSSTGSGSTGSGSTGTGSGSTGSGSTGSGSGGTGSGGTGSGTLPGGTLPGGGTVPGSGTATSASIATKAEQRGVVTIVSVLKYQNAESAGTGMILTSNGEILTNNHVIDGATSITVTVESTGTSYRATVVGTDPTADVAVLQLQNASGLTTAAIDATPDVSVGDAVVGVGNAGGTGTLRASKGKVTDLQQSITASDDDGANAERLTGLIEVDAPIISGDSGGPMYNAAGTIIGMNTAASTTNGMTATTAYAIPIRTAENIAAQIEKGVETSTIHIGVPGFIGVGVADTNGAGAAITSVLAGGPADTAGITTGSVITRVGGTRVTSSASLKTALNGDKPGSSVRITWTGVDGTSHTATVKLATGPAD